MAQVRVDIGAREPKSLIELVGDTETEERRRIKIVGLWAYIIH